MTRAEKREVAIHLKAVNELKPDLLAAEGALSDFRKRVTDGFKQAGKVIGAALIAGLTAATLVGADFEQSMANVGSVTNATVEDMAALEAKARDMGATTAFSAAEAAGAMYSLASAGLDTANIIGTSESVLKLAGATMSDMGQTAELVTASMKQFGLSAEDSTRIANTLAAGTQASMLTMDRLANAMKYAGSIAPSVNMSLEETVAVMGLMVDKGLDASQAGTGFRSMMLQLLDPSKDLKAALGDVSIESDGLAAVIRQLGTVSATELPKLFQAESFSAVNALVRSGAEAFEQMTDRVTGTNAAFEMYERQMATTTGRFKILKSAVQEDLIAVFLEIKPTIDEVLESVTAFVTEAKPMLVGMARDLRDAFVAATDVIGGFIGFISRNGETVLAFASAIAAATAVLYGYSLAAKAAAVSTKVLTAAMALISGNPVVVALAAVAAVLGFIIVKMGGWQQAWIKVRYGAEIAIQSIMREFVALKVRIAESPEWFVALGSVIDSFFTRSTNAIKNFTTQGSQLLGGLWWILAHPFDQGLGVAMIENAMTAAVTEAFAGYGEEVSRLMSFQGGETEQLVRSQYQRVIAALKAERDAALADLNASSDATGSEAPEVVAAKYQVAMAQFKANAAALSKIFGSMWQGQPVAKIIDDLRDVGSESRTAFQIMRDEIHSALTDLGSFAEFTSANVKVAVADTFTAMADGIGAAVEDSKRKLIDLEGLARGLFGSLLAGLAKFAIGSGLSALGPWGAGVASLMGFEKRAFGGPVHPGQPYLVGENGPELRMFGSSGTIISNSQLRALAAGGGGGMNVSVQVSLPSSSVLFADNKLAVRRFSEQISREITEKVNKTFRES